VKDLKALLMDAAAIGFSEQAFMDVVGCKDALSPE